MKELQMIFSAEMVRAILDGKKTQTRRIIKQLLPECGPWDEAAFLKKCPYGQPQDRLGVRESFARNVLVPGAGKLDIVYRADAVRDDSGERDGWWIGENFLPGHVEWESPYYMSREKISIWLEIVDIWIERLQDIDDAGCLDEGTDYFFSGESAIKSIRGRFSVMWDYINGKSGYGWDLNPWVWVIEFRSVSKTGRAR